ncbi:MAG TPA: DmsE family decaheme c-type cytochrome [Myxococcota bacterium]
MGSPGRSSRGAVLVAGMVVALLRALPAMAEDPAPIAPASHEAKAYSEDGVDTCLECHDESEKRPVLSILATPHAVLGDPRTPLAQQHSCETCHGPSAAHVEEESTAVDVVFGAEAPAEAQNAKCLSCHQGGLRMGWAGSKHDLQNVACAACHTVHAREDRVLTKNIDPMRFNREGQASVCFQCHMEKRAQIQHRVSAHPLREGKINCSDCHNPHGSMGPTNLTRPTLNETCYQCHAEKRGPFLWEHAPVREDCGICHEPHGSNNPTLLKRRMPQLCEECHAAAQHPSTGYGGPALVNPVNPAAQPQLQGDRRVVAGSCLNCHSEIHGSNHPSGVRWTR